MSMQNCLVGLYLAAVLGPGEGQDLHPGSRLSIEEASMASQIVVMATITNPGRYAIPIQGGSAYTGIRLRPSRFLKGKMVDQELIVYWLGVLTFLDGTSEVRPEDGKESLFFIEQRSPWNNTCVKVIPALPANVAAVEGVLRKEERLSGSGMSITMATLRSSMVVVGTLSELGEAHAGPNSTVVYTGSVFRVRRALMGPAEGRLTLDFSVTIAPAEVAENTPGVGKDYILFLETQRDGPVRGCKLLPATNAEHVEVQIYIDNKNNYR
jgi:hypothetical protein